MIDNLLAALRAEYERLVTVTICAAVIAASGLVAVLFVAVAVFVWTSDHYGTAPAALAMAAFFAAVALIAWGIAAYVASVAREKARQRAAEEKKKREEEAKHAPWIDPALLATVLPIGLEAVKFAVRNRGLLVALASSIALGWATVRERRHPAEDAPEGQPAE